MGPTETGQRNVGYKTSTATIVCVCVKLFKVLAGSVIDRKKTVVGQLVNSKKGRSWPYSAM